MLYNQKTLRTARIRSGYFEIGSIEMGGSMDWEQEEVAGLRRDTQAHFLVSQVPKIPQLRGVLQSTTHLHVL